MSESILDEVKEVFPQCKVEMSQRDEFSNYITINFWREGVILVDSDETKIDRNALSQELAESKATMLETIKRQWGI